MAKPKLYQTNFEKYQNDTKIEECVIFDSIGEYSITN